MPRPAAHYRKEQYAPGGAWGRRCRFKDGNGRLCNRWNQGQARVCRGCGARLIRRPKRKKASLSLEQWRDLSHDQLLQAITRMKRALTSCELWRRRIKHYERAIDERDHPRPPRPPRIRVPQHRRRTVLLSHAEQE